VATLHVYSGRSLVPFRSRLACGVESPASEQAGHGRAHSCECESTRNTTDALSSVPPARVRGEHAVPMCRPAARRGPCIRRRNDPRFRRCLTARPPRHYSSPAMRATPNPLYGLPRQVQRLIDLRSARRVEPAVVYPASEVGCVLSARADTESASARRQSLRAAGVKLPEGLSASCAVGVTRGAMVGDQSLRNAVEGWSDQSISARVASSCCNCARSKRSVRPRWAEPRVWRVLR
jgi:hypothetical protein